MPKARSSMKSISFAQSRRTFARSMVLVCDMCTCYDEFRTSHIASVPRNTRHHYTDVIIDTMTSQISSLTIVYSTVYSDADQRKHQSSASLAFVRGIHRRLVNSPHKWPVKRKMFPFDDVIMMLWAFVFERLAMSNVSAKVWFIDRLVNMLWIVKMT